MKKALVILWLILSVNVYSQNESIKLQELISKDSTSIPFICSYPDSFRKAVLIASTYPQGLIRLEEIQKASSKSFQQAISGYNDDRQKQLWEIIRYPELPALLIANKDKSEKELKVLLKNYPEELTKCALHFTKKDLTILITIDNLNKQFETGFKETIKEFPADIQESYSLLVSRPELLSALTDDIKTTIILGDIYKNNPGLVKHVTDSINAEIVKENMKEYEAWKKRIESDPGVQKDLRKLAEKYQKEEDMNDDVYAKNNYDVNIYYIQPYPYWAGHPNWFITPYWYPYPWWYHSGYYYYPGRGIIIRSMPTYHFGWWYYGHRNYPRKYPKADKYFQQHYYGHRNSNFDFNRSLRDKKVSPRGRKR